MSTPFLDPAWIIAALNEAVAALPCPVAVSELGAVAEVSEPRMTEAATRIHVVAERTQADGPAGLGNGRGSTDTVALILRVQDAAPDDHGAGSRLTVRALRGVVFAALEGLRVDAGWSPLRYLGGELMLQERGVYRTYHWVERYAADTRLPVRPRT